MIKLRTFHFPPGKQFQYREFRSVKPINSAKLAFEFIHQHYHIGNKRIEFTIVDKKTGKQYNYSAAMTQNGININAI